MKLIEHVTIYTVNKNFDVIKDGQLLIDQGRIVDVGVNLKADQQVQRIDGAGAVVTPGLIDIHTHVGLWGETTGDTSDGNEASAPFTPTVHAVDAINPQHISFADARSGGVTTVQTGAGSGNPIGGVWSIVKTSGNTVEDMLVRERSALKGALGENPKNLFGQLQKQSPYTRMSTAHWIRQGFQRARLALEENRASVAALYRANEGELLPFVEVLEGKMPLRLHAHRADDIVTAVRIAQEFDVQLSIEHCTEGFKVAEFLQAAGYPVTLGPFMGAATKYEIRDMNLENPKVLSGKGILTAIITDHPFVPIQYLSICAAESVKHGLAERDALKAITINPAIIGGVEQRVGSLEPGKDADFVLWSEHPFKMKANVLSTWIEGEIVYQNSRVQSESISKK